MTVKSSSKRVGVVVAAVAAVLFIAIFWIAHAMSQEYVSFERPDGNYRIVVSTKASLSNLRIGFGGAGDSPGVVELFDRGGKRLQKADVEMVQIVERVDWGDRSVRIKHVAEWALPD
jgi:hypothetical protein